MVEISINIAPPPGWEEMPPDLREVIRELTLTMIEYPRPARQNRVLGALIRGLREPLSPLSLMGEQIPCRFTRAIRYALEDTPQLPVTTDSFSASVSRFMDDVGLLASHITAADSLPVRDMDAFSQLPLAGVTVTRLLASPHGLVRELCPLVPDGQQPCPQLVWKALMEMLSSGDSPRCKEIMDSLESPEDTSVEEAAGYITALSQYEVQAITLTRLTILYEMLVSLGMPPFNPDEVGNTEDALSEIMYDLGSLDDLLKGDGYERLRDNTALHCWTYGRELVGVSGTEYSGDALVEVSNAALVRYHDHLHTLCGSGRHS